MWSSTTLLAVLAACGTSPTSPSTDTTTDTASTTGTATETSTQPQQELLGMGSLMLVNRIVDGEEQRELFGLFIDRHESFINLARCVVDSRACFNILPAETDVWVDLDPRLDWEREGAFYFVGMDIGLGPYTADYAYNDVNRTAYYYRDLSSEKPHYGASGVRYGVEWDAYSGEDDIALQEPIEVVSPDPYTELQFTEGGRIPFEWTPTGEGDVYLRVTAFNYERLYWLQDDGYYLFDVDDLGFSAQDEFVRVALGRWNRSQLDNEGYLVDVVDLTEVEWNGGFYTQSSRDELDIADTCLEALGLTPLTDSGSYWGRMGGFRGDLDPMEEGNDCATYNAPGNEGIVPIEVESMEVVTANYVLRSGDASMYILTDCSDAGTCVRGVDEYGMLDAERMQYFNATSSTQQLYLVLDAYTNQTGGTMLGTFQLDLNVQHLDEPVMHDACLDAQTSKDSLDAGLYYTEYLPYTNLLNPGAGGCTGTSLSGPESLTRVTVPPGTTMSAVINMPGGNPGLYLLYNCTNAFSCPVGADQRMDSQEALAYTNTGSVPETLYLVVDSSTALQPYFLTIDMQ